MDQSLETPEETFARQFKESRVRKGWSQKDVTERLAEIGVQFDRSAIAKMENASRALSLNTSLQLAAALGVSPVHLFVLRQGREMRLAPKLVVESGSLRRWVRGIQPLRAEDARFYRQEVSDEEWVAMQRAGIQNLLDLVQDLVDAAVADDRDSMADRIDDINDELDRQRSALERGR
jgi:transcriptional regulator with XRE-family HTH domain